MNGGIPQAPKLTAHSAADEERSRQVGRSSPPAMSRQSLHSKARIGLSATILTAIAASTPEISKVELSIFRWVNGLPVAFRIVFATTMQLGSLAAVPSVAGAALLARRPQLAKELLLAGGGSWCAAKVMKVAVPRERPALLLNGVLLHGREQSGTGFPSGHTAVAAALATVAGQSLGPAVASCAWASVITVALGRTYVGAHLPVDVIGGGALGFTIGTMFVSRRLPSVGDRGGKLV
jgi:membrane-associated phospholipid phosphatase